MDKPDSFGRGQTLRFNPTPRDRQRNVSVSHQLGHLERQLVAGIVKGIDALQLKAGDRLLDFGCADQPYRQKLPSGVLYAGADLPGNPVAEIKIDDNSHLPVEARSFEAILSTQVLEHVQDPRSYLEECERVLVDGGRLMLSTHGIMIYHPDPVDYWRWTSAGLRRQIEASGFRIVSCEGVFGLAPTALYLFQLSVRPRLPKKVRGLFTRVMQWLIRWFDRWETATNRDLNALVYVVVAEKMAVREAKKIPDAA